MYWIANQIQNVHAVILPSLMHAYKTWKVYSCHTNKLNSFHMRSLRKLLHIKWQDRNPDIEVFQRTNMVSMHAMLKGPSWDGKLCGSDEHLPKRLFYGELKTGKCTHRCQKKWYKDTLKVLPKKLCHHFQYLGESCLSLHHPAQPDQH